MVGETVKTNAAPQACCQKEKLCTMIRESFRGPQAWMAVIAWVYSIGFTVVAVLAAWRFFQVDNTRHQLMYATIFLAALLFVAVTKLWYWMMLYYQSLGRELRRIEKSLGGICRPGEGI